MRVLIAISALFLFIHLNCYNKSKTEKLVVNAIILNKLLGESKKQTDFNYYNLRIELRNNSDSTIRLWTMSCSWEENWIFNNDSLALRLINCDSNYPIIIELEPGHVIGYDHVLIVHKSFKIKENTNLLNKIGFIYIKENEIKNIEDFRHLLNDRKRNKTATVWSSGY